MMEVETLININPDNPQERLIKRAAEILRDGGVIAYPTDTIYGIGCDIYNKKALDKIYLMKGRDKRKPMSFVCSDLSHISQFARVSNSAYRIMKRCLPGPYTFILEASSEVPKMLMTKSKTVGIRIPDNEITLQLVKYLGNPIISTSANITGEDAISDPVEIDLYLGKFLDATIDAGILLGEPSTIIDLSGNVPTLIREGAGGYSWIV